MKVYIVSELNLNAPSTIIGVFLDKAEAEAFAAERAKTARYSVVTEEWEVR